MLDILIIGAGPAGIQASYFLKKHGISHKILEKGQRPGAFFEQYPRHRMLISINKKYTGSDHPEFNLRHDWNSLLSSEGPKFTEYDDDLFPAADSLLKYLDDFVAQENIDITYNAEVSCIDKEHGHFVVTLTDGSKHEAKNVIVATGFNLTNKPQVEGIEYAEDYSVMSVDKKDFINKRVLVIGKGNSAFETADHLAGVTSLIHMISPTPTRLAWQTHYVGNLRAVNNNILDMYQLKSQHAILDATIDKISKEGDKYRVDISYAHAEGETETLYYDTILCCAGFKLDNSIFSESCMPVTVMNGKYPQLSTGYESVNVPGLYFAGTLTHAHDYRKGTSGFIHGFRYNVQALTNILNHRLNNAEIDHKKIKRDVSDVTHYLLNRFNVVSSIWQQPSILAEVFKITDDNVEHYEAMPVNYAVEDYFNKDDVVLITFEYGDHIEGDIFKQARIARDNFANSQQSQFLHPVLRFYSQGKLTEEFHVIEDLEANWTVEEHYDHISSFISKVMREMAYE